MRNPSPFDEFVERYNLTRYFQRDNFSTVVPPVIAVAHGNQLDILSLAGDIQKRTRLDDKLYSLAAIPTNKGTKIIAGSLGKLSILGPDGSVEKTIQIGEARVWHITWFKRENFIYLISCFTNKSIRLFNLLGQLQCEIETPGRVLSTDVAVLDGHFKLVGGTQERNHLYVWDLDDVVFNRDATPETILKGGNKGAFCVKFVEIGRQPKILHGSWDGNIYIYDWLRVRGQKVVKPSLKLKGGDSIYAVELFTSNGTTWILASTETGLIQVWPVMVDTDPKFTLAHLGVRIKSMKILRIGEKNVLIAGTSDGRVFIYEFYEFKDNMEPKIILNVGQEEVNSLSIFNQL